MRLYLFAAVAGISLLPNVSAAQSDGTMRGTVAHNHESQEANMPQEMPSSSEFTGLTRTVIAYSEEFNRLTETAKTRALTDEDWKPIEQLVDVDAFQREGVFLGPEAEVIGWPTYRQYVTQYGGNTSWAGTLRNVTETPGRVILELEERNTTNGRTGVSNTVTIYEFNDAGKLQHLDVYVMPLGQAHGR